VSLRTAYDFVFEVERSAMTGADDARPAPREDLRTRWSPA